VQSVKAAPGGGFPGLYHATSNHKLSTILSFRALVGIGKAGTCEGTLAEHVSFSSSAHGPCQRAFCISVGKEVEARNVSKIAE